MDDDEAVTESFHGVAEDLSSAVDFCNISNPILAIFLVDRIGVFL